MGAARVARLMWWHCEVGACGGGLGEWHGQICIVCRQRVTKGVGVHACMDSAPVALDVCHASGSVECFPSAQ